MEKSKKGLGSETELGELFRKVCQTQFGVLDRSFLCRSIGSLDPKAPIMVSQGTSVHDVLLLLKENKIGVVIIVDDNGVLSGIFSERDALLKVFLSDLDLKKTPIASVMTPDPVSETADGTVAYALNLMSNGGFRHLPIIDSEDHPVGILSVKDIVDFIVEKFTEDILNFEVA